MKQWTVGTLPIVRKSRKLFVNEQIREDMGIKWEEERLTIGFGLLTYVKLNRLTLFNINCVNYIKIY